MILVVSPSSNPSVCSLVGTMRACWYLDLTLSRLHVYSVYKHLTEVYINNSIVRLRQFITRSISPPSSDLSLDRVVYNNSCLPDRHLARWDQNIWGGWQHYILCSGTDCWLFWPGLYLWRHWPWPPLSPGGSLWALVGRNSSETAPSSQ